MMTPLSILTRHRLEARRRFVEYFHKTLHSMMTLAAGSLTLLVAFVDNYTSHQSVCWWMVPVSWGLLSFSLVLGLVTLVGESYRPRRTWEELDRISRETGDAVEQMKRKGKARDYEQECEYLENAISHLNDAPPKIYTWTAWGTAVTLILGLFAIGLFAVLNSHNLARPESRAIQASMAGSKLEMMT